MKSMLRSAILLIALGTAVVPVFAQDGTVIVEKDEFRLTVRIVGANAEITVRGRTTGWVAVGFDPVNMMKNADIKMGYVKNGEAFARDDFGTAIFLHSDDTKVKGTSNILAIAGTESEGYTTMTFLVPRDSGDPKDAKILKGPHNVILAAGRADNFSSKHMFRVKTSIVLP